jgi:uncharacterized membrane protein
MAADRFENWPEVVLWSVGALLIVIGAVNRRRKEKNALYFLIPGIVIFILGCLVLPL